VGDGGRAATQRPRPRPHNHSSELDRQRSLAFGLPNRPPPDTHSTVHSPQHLLHCSTLQGAQPAASVQIFCCPQTRQPPRQHTTQTQGPHKYEKQLVWTATLAHHCMTRVHKSRRTAVGLLQGRVASMNQGICAVTNDRCRQCLKQGHSAIAEQQLCSIVTIANFTS